VGDALIAARRRGVAVRLILNGHLAWEGDPARERSMHEELHQRRLLPAVARLRDAGIALALVYGVHDRAVPYSPLHSKQCVIDEQIVIDGSFNWYNTSVLSHDLLVVVNHRDTARLYLEEARQILHGFRVHWLSGGDSEGGRWKVSPGMDAD
jgi:phosphatidylserine/phosphatidylglycerophosphate/cardiolipin synthase-like enzyme